MHSRLMVPKLNTALSDTRVVILAGPRQSGKTTLARNVASDDMPYFTLDDVNTRNAALADPIGFLQGLNKAVIDEVQRAPDLILSIKAAVDRDPTPGRFLLTGSSDLMALPKVADSLAGRTEALPLYPFAQAELAATQPNILTSAFGGQLPKASPTTNLMQRVLAGGYPEAVARKDPDRRQDWYDAYTDAMLGRDVREVAQIDHYGSLPRLFRLLAEGSAQLVNASSLGRAVGLTHVTCAKYIRVLEQLFLIHSLPAWSSNATKRLVKTPKLHFLDAGLLAAVRGVTADQLATDSTPLGAILESFTVAEVMKLGSVTPGRLTYSHFRDKDGKEVDLVVESRRGDVVGIEVKAGATVRAGDFAGLKRLNDLTGDAFKMGIVFYDGDQVLPFGAGLYAVPFGALWG